MLKGSIQLSCRPDLGRNTVNLVPLVYCASIVLTSSLDAPLQQGVGIVHVTPSPQMDFNAFLETLEKYGYRCRWYLTQNRARRLSNTYPAKAKNNVKRTRSFHSLI
ncbi:hypothetical protein BDR22DRAFT_832572, partial [Usnea florida]